VRDAGIRVAHVVDVGSGEGPYLAAMLQAFPAARGTWLDSSEPMLARAREALAPFGDRVTYVVAAAEGLGRAGIGRAEVVVSSRALHHLTRPDLAAAYADVSALLAPGGWFFNLEHVGAAGDLESRYRRIREQFTGRRRRALQPHRQDEPLLPVPEHLDLLRAAGFAAVDVPWRMLSTALLAAVR
jgi:SAM-dependent methyltransferase